MTVQERITAARRELRAALKAKKAQMTGSSIVKVSDDTYEYPDLAEVVKETYIICKSDITNEVYIAGLGLAHVREGGKLTISLPSYVVRKYGVKDLVLCRERISIDGLTAEDTVKSLCPVLAEVRRAAYNRCVELIKEAAADMPLEEANAMPF